MERLNPADSLSPEKLQLFIAGLSGLPQEEVRKAKALYLHNAISEYRALMEAHAGFGCVQLFFAVIPFFWPILYAQRRGMAAQENLLRERIRNALHVWKDDLAGEHFEVPWAARESQRGRGRRDR